MLDMETIIIKPRRYVVPTEVFSEGGDVEGGCFVIEGIFGGGEPILRFVGTILSTEEILGRR